MSTEVDEPLVTKVDEAETDGSGNLSFQQFLICPNMIFVVL